MSTSTSSPSALAPATSCRVRIEVFPHSQSASLDFYTRVLRFTRPHSPFPIHIRPSKDIAPGDTEAQGYVHVTRGPIILGLSWQAQEHFHPIAKDTTQKYELRHPPLGTELVLVLPTTEALHAERQHILEQGWKLAEDLELKPWGIWDFRLQDPDGYYWRLTTEESEAETQTQAKK